MSLSIQPSTYLSLELLECLVELLLVNLNTLMPWLQAEKLWIGYVEQSKDSGRMLLPTFWAICEAVSQGDVQAAEFADMTVEEYVSYGSDDQHAVLMRSSMPDALAEAQQDIAAIRASKKRIEDATKKAEEIVNAASTKVQAAARGRQVRQKKDLLEKSAVTLQRALRRLQQQWHEGKKWDFAAVVRAVKGQRREWAMEFQRVAGEGGLDQQAFVHALSRACSGRVSSLQARQFEAELFNAIARLAYSCRDDDVSQDTAREHQ